jgi:hypothetical protein
VSPPFTGAKLEGVIPVQREQLDEVRKT